MSGLGAWHFGWYEFKMPVPNPRVGAGIVAFKHELAFNGLTGYGMKLDLQYFGDSMKSAVVAFQKTEGIGSDGVIGPTTAKHLWRKRGRELQALNGCPNDYVLRIAALESSDDPVAQGFVDVDDEGLMQINLRLHPNLSLAEAWNPAQAMPFAEATLYNQHAYTGSWEGAVAAWNIGGYYAKLWVAASYPPSGGPSLGLDQQGHPIDSFARATQYLSLIDQQTV